MTIGWEREVSTEAVWKLGEISQTIEQSKIFRDFFDSERSRASQKRTKQAVQKDGVERVLGVQPV